MKREQQHRDKALPHTAAFVPQPSTVLPIVRLRIGAETIDGTTPGRLSAEARRY
jgi:hypothetical protein